MQGVLNQSEENKDCVQQVSREKMLADHSNNRSVCCLEKKKIKNAKEQERASIVHHMSGAKNSCEQLTEEARSSMQHIMHGKDCA